MFFKIEIYYDAKKDNWFFTKDDFSVRRNDWRNNKRRLNNLNYVLKQLTK